MTALSAGEVAAAASFSRSDNVPPGYSVRWHLVSSAFIVGLILGGAGWLARDAAPWQWLALPVFWIVGNTIEWAVHRYPMHRPMPPRMLYMNHALIHHRAFLQDTMEIKATRELGLVMMPWYTLLLIFASASPVAIAAGLLGGWPLSGIFYLASVVHFVGYEALHASYHLPGLASPPRGVLGRVFAALRAHHTHHHRLDRMAHVNFNVTLPLADALFGTRERPGDAAQRPPVAAAPAATAAATNDPASQAGGLA